MAWHDFAYNFASSFIFLFPYWYGTVRARHDKELYKTFLSIHIPRLKPLDLNSSLLKLTFLPISIANATNFDSICLLDQINTTMSQIHLERKMEDCVGFRWYSNAELSKIFSTFAYVHNTLTLRHQIPLLVSLYRSCAENVQKQNNGDPQHTFIRMRLHSDNRSFFHSRFIWVRCLVSMNILIISVLVNGEATLVSVGLFDKFTKLSVKR